VGNDSVVKRDETSLARLKAELERLAGELASLGGEEPPPSDPAAARERAADRLRRRLYEARKARGLRQCDLAERLGRPQSFVSNYERGERRLEVSEFITIAQALGLDAAAVVAELSVES
jgi:ribosome-binding protein aMBF1 (putative translation factor)